MGNCYVIKIGAMDYPTESGFCFERTMKNRTISTTMGSKGGPNLEGGGTAVL